jgi:Ca-activated chloride channel family protein
MSWNSLFNGDVLHFRDSGYLLLLCLLPLLYWWEKKRREPHVVYSDLGNIRRVKPSIKVKLFPLKKWVRLAAFTCVVFALARPQSGRVTTEIITHGVDILLAIDTSGSMRGEDFQLDGQRVTRLDAVKSVVKNFVEQRKSDRMGMVVFGTQAFTQCPLTLDHGVLLTFLKQLEIGMAGEKTAIGSAIGSGVNRLKDLKSKSRILILLTDGENTAGEMDPAQAAEIASAFNIKIYTIGVGSKGKAPFKVDTVFGPQYQYLPSEIDEVTLKKIADQTGGKYYRAENTEELKTIYKEIDQLEKTKAKVKEYMDFTELFHWFVWCALLLILFDKILDLTYFRRLP